LLVAYHLQLMISSNYLTYLVDIEYRHATY